jgi:hypothetical protein
MRNQNDQAKSPDRDAAASASSRSTREAVLCAILALLLLFASGWKWVEADFGFGGIVSHLARFGEIYANSWDDLGFSSTLGVPLSLNTGDTIIDRVPYAHMPPAGWWPPYLGRSIWGKSTFGLKFFPTLFSMLGIAGLAWMIARATRPLLGLATVVVCLGMPAVQLYGAMPGIESISLLMVVIFVAAWERAQRRLTWFNGALFLLGCCTAWPFYFVAPGLLLASLARGSREWCRALPLFPLGVVGFLLVVLHLWMGIGDLSFILNDLRETIHNTTQDGIGGDVERIGERGAFAKSILPMIRLNLGIESAILAGCTLLATLLLRRWRRDFVTYLSIVLLTIGLCNVVLFNGRSSSHAYYYFLLSLAVGLVLVNALRLLAQGLAKWTGRTPLSVGLASATIVGCLFVGLWTNWAVKLQQEAPGVRQLARQIDDQVPPGQAILWHSDSVLDAVV